MKTTPFEMVFIIRDVCSPKFEDILLSPEGVFVPRKACINGVDHLSGLVVCGGRLFQKLVIARIVHLHAHGLEMDDIYNMPAVSQADDPTKPASTEELGQYTRDLPPIFDGEDQAEKLGISIEQGAVV